MRSRLRWATPMAIALAIVISGCATQRQPMYAWCNYSDSLYQCKKNESPETLEQHVQVLERILAESNTRNLRIPPGVCAELGYYYATRNNPGKAVELFRREKQTYPESTLLMDRLISRTEKTAAPQTPEAASTEGLLKQETAIGSGEGTAK